MDPEACLSEAESDIDDGEYVSASQHVQDYRTWRSKGGFEPLNGDQRLAECDRRLLLAFVSCG